MRRTFAETLTRLGADHQRLVFVTGDMGFQMFDDFRERYGGRYINVGVAEAQLVNAAAGLALEGWRPVAYSIASFLTGRPFEQIRVSVNYNNLPVLLVGAGGGYTYAASGVTHHAADDLALMGLLPNMRVVAPGDPTEVAQLVPQLIELDGPCYLRLGRQGEPSYDAEERAVFGRARRVRNGGRIAVITTGDLALSAVQAFDVLRDEGITPMLYQMHTVKPLDTGTLDRLAEQVDVFVVVEEHVPSGALFSAISAWRAARHRGPRLVRLGAADALVLGSSTREELRRRLGCDPGAIAEVCRREWASAGRRLGALQEGR